MPSLSPGHLLAAAQQTNGPGRHCQMLTEHSGKEERAGGAGIHAELESAQGCAAGRGRLPPTMCTKPARGSLSEGISANGSLMEEHRISVAAFIRKKIKGWQPS